MIIAKLCEHTKKNPLNCTLKRVNYISMKLLYLKISFWHCFRWIPYIFICCILILIQFYVFLNFPLRFSFRSMDYLVVLKFYFQVYIDFPLVFLLLIASLVPLQLENTFCVVSRIMALTKMSISWSPEPVIMLCYIEELSLQMKLKLLII